MLCKNCGLVLPDDTKVCPRCKKNPHKQSKKYGQIIVIAILVISIIGSGLYYTVSIYTSRKHSQTTTNEEITQNRAETFAAELTATSVATEQYTNAEQTQASSVGETVYISQSGKKYHRQSCTYYKDSFTDISVNEATDKGYLPCSVCFKDASETTANQSTTQTSSVGETVYISQSGKKYHKQSCTYYKDSFTDISVNEATDKGYLPCSICFKDASETTANQSTTQTSSVGETVYISQSGKKYHKQSCTYYKDSFTDISLSDATDKGYLPCSVCFKDASETANSAEEGSVYYITSDGYYHLISCEKLTDNAQSVSSNDTGFTNYKACPVCEP